MNETYNRKLTQTEAERHFIYVEFKYRKLFPSKGKIFRMKTGNKEFKVSIDKLWRIHAPFYKLVHFEKGIILSISKESESVFEVSSHKS